MYMNWFLFTYLSFVLGHMEMRTPSPRRSQFSEYYQKKNDVDWDLNSPNGSQFGLDYPFPCRGSPKGPAEYSYKAGDIINAEFTKIEGSNLHNGGHCQFGLSYDNGKTIVVLLTVLSRCFLDGLTFPVQIPDTAPSSDKAVFTWTWINAIGNREYYMNCVDIILDSDQVGGSLTGPSNLIGNMPGYPIFPEFYQKDRHELFENRTTITIQP